MTTPGNTLDRALGEHVVIDSTNIPAGIVIASDVADGSITGAKLDSFTSTEITGAGSETSYAHGLGHTPTFVIIQVLSDSGTVGSLAITEGVHTATNILVDAAASTTFVIKAF